jgi:hypothetical protein
MYAWNVLNGRQMASRTAADRGAGHGRRALSRRSAPGRSSALTFAAGANTDERGETPSLARACGVQCLLRPLRQQDQLRQLIRPDPGANVGRQAFERHGMALSI